MAVITDAIETVFKVSGIQSVVFAMTAAENATDRLANAEARLHKAQANAYYGSGSMDAVQIAQRRLNVAERGEREAAFTAAATAAQPYIKALTTIIGLSEKAIQATAKFGTEVMDLKARTGGSGTEAAGMLNLLSGAGIGSGGVGAIEGLNKKVFTGEGQTALQQLGINPRQGESSIQLFDEIANRLSKMQDGWYKMRIEQQLGVEGMQGLLRMSQATRTAILGFSDSMGGDALATIQRFNEATGLLGVGIQSGIIQPIGTELMKILTPAIDLVNDLIKAWHEFDTALGGAGSKVVAVLALVGGFAAAAAAVYQMVEAIKALQIAEKAMIVVQAVLDALEGNYGAIAAAIAIGAGAAALSGGLGGGGTETDKVDEFGKHIDNFGDAVNQWRDMSQSGKFLGGGGNKMNDIAYLTRLRAIGAIS